MEGLEPIKNIAHFLEECMPALASRRNDFELLIVGTGRDEERVMRAAGGLRECERGPPRHFRIMML